MSKTLDLFSDRSQGITEKLQQQLALPSTQDHIICLLLQVNEGQHALQSTCLYPFCINVDDPCVLPSRAANAMQNELGK